MRTVQSCPLSSPMHHQLDPPSWRKGKEYPKLEAAANCKQAETVKKNPLPPNSTLLEYQPPWKRGLRSREAIGTDWHDNFYALFQVLDGSFQCNSPAPSSMQPSLLTSLDEEIGVDTRSCGKSEKSALLPKGRKTVLAM